MEDVSALVHQAFQVIQQGGIILYPTDTVWGIGCDATNEAAVQRIYDLKKRTESKSMIVLVNGDRLMHQMFAEIPETAWQIWDFANKPTTLVLEKPRNVAPNLIAEDNSLGVRIVKEPFCYKLIERMKKPLVSTSANISGQPTPSCFRDIAPEIVQGVDYVVPLHLDKKNQQASSIIKLGLDMQVKVIRK